MSDPGRGKNSLQSKPPTDHVFGGLKVDKFYLLYNINTNPFLLSALRSQKGFMMRRFAFACFGIAVMLVIWLSIPSNFAMAEKLSAAAIALLLPNKMTIGFAVTSLIAATLSVWAGLHLTWPTKAWLNKHPRLSKVLDQMENFTFDWESATSGPHVIRAVGVLVILIVFIVFVRAPTISDKMNVVPFLFVGGVLFAWARWLARSIEWN